MQTLIQSNIFKTTKYAITEDGLEINFKSLNKISREIILFQEIGSKINIEKKYNSAIFYPFIFMLCISGLRLLASKSIIDHSFVFLIYVTIVIFIILYFTSKKVLNLESPGTRVVSFHPSKPNKEKVEEFITGLLEKRNRILRMKFGNIAPQLPYEIQHERILWLNEIGVLSNDELVEKKNKLNTIFQGKDGNSDIHLN